MAAVRAINIIQVTLAELLAELELVLEGGIPVSKIRVPVMIAS